MCVQPLLIMQASRDLATEYSAKARVYDQLWAPMLRQMAQPLIAALPLAAAHDVLDVGTGTGVLLPDVRSLAPHASVIGVDRAEGMLRVGQERGHEALIVVDAHQLPFRSKSFDVVTLAFVLFHLPDPMYALSSIRAMLRARGVMGVATWGEDPGMPGISVWREELDSLGAEPDSRDASVMQQERMDSPAKLTELIQASGFRAVQVWEKQFSFPWKLHDVLAVQAGCGMPSRRLKSMAPARQALCRSRVEARLASLKQDELVYHPEVLYAIASPTA